MRCSMTISAFLFMILAGCNQGGSGNSTGGATAGAPLFQARTFSVSGSNVSVSLQEPNPLVTGTSVALSGQISPASPGIVIRVNWYNQGPNTPPPSNDRQWSTATLNGTGSSFSVATVIDEPGVLGQMWIQLNGG